MVLLEEVRRLPEDVLSFTAAAERILEANYTDAEIHSHLSPHVIKADLNTSLARMNPIICREVDIALREYLPPCNDWTDVPIYGLLVRIIAKVSGTVFVGADLASDPEYLDCGVNYTVLRMEAVAAVKNVRPWLRPIICPRLPEIEKLCAMEKRAIKHLRPIIEARQKAEKNDPNWQKPDDLMQWLLERAKKEGDVSVKHITRTQLGLIFAAIHTTTITATNVLYTLATSPDYIEPLREEVREVLTQNSGKITTRGLQQIEKLDSFIKEDFRFHPPSISTFSRRVRKGITLSNGQYIPAGVMIEAPSQEVYFDPAFYPNADTFDGFRHYKARQSGKAADHARNQFVTTNETNLSFGYGPRACPGRFFAANEIKMILARVLLDFDVKMPGDATERHAQIAIGKSEVPDATKMLSLKRIN